MEKHFNNDALKLHNDILIKTENINCYKSNLSELMVKCSTMEESVNNLPLDEYMKRIDEVSGTLS